MNGLIDLAGIAMSIAISVGFALWLEWLTLRSLMRVMPPRNTDPNPALTGAASPSINRRNRTKIGERLG